MTASQQIVTLVQMAFFEEERLEVWNSSLNCDVNALTDNINEAELALSETRLIADSDTDCAEQQPSSLPVDDPRFARHPSAAREDTLEYVFPGMQAAKIRELVERSWTSYCLAKVWRNLAIPPILTIDSGAVTPDISCIYIGRYGIKCNLRRGT